MRPLGHSGAGGQPIQTMSIRLFSIVVCVQRVLFDTKYSSPNQNAPAYIEFKTVGGCETGPMVGGGGHRHGGCDEGVLDRPLRLKVSPIPVRSKVEFSFAQRRESRTRFTSLYE